MAETLWKGIAAAYDRSFATLCAGTIPVLLEGIPARSRVLDVGCGSGHLTAALVAEGHDVLAVDPDPEMVELTRARAAADVRVGGLPDLPVDRGSFEVVLANFVLNHVDDPRAAVRALVPALRPGGRLAATIWPTSPPPQAQLWNTLLDAAGAVRPQMPRLAPELDFERSPQGLADVLAAAGLEAIEQLSPTWDWSVRPDEFWAGVTSVGNFGVAWRAQPPEVQDAMSGAFAEAAEPWLVNGRLVFPVEAVMVWAAA